MAISGNLAKVNGHLAKVPGTGHLGKCLFICSEVTLRVTFSGVDASINMNCLNTTGNLDIKAQETFIDGTYDLPFVEESGGRCIYQLNPVPGTQMEYESYNPLEAPDCGGSHTDDTIGSPNTAIRIELDAATSLIEVIDWAGGVVDWHWYRSSTDSGDPGPWDFDETIENHLTATSFSLPGRTPTVGGTAVVTVV